MFVERLLGGDVGVDVDIGQLSLIVEHLLEVRDEPLAIDRVPVEAASQMIANPAAGHLHQREVEQLGCVGVGLVLQHLLHEQQLRRRGKLRAIGSLRLEIDSAEVGIKTVGHGLERLRHQRVVHFDRLQRQLRPHHPTSLVGEDVGVAFELLAFVFPQIGEPSQDRGEAHALVRVFRRKVRSARNRLAVGSDEHRERPPATGRSTDGLVVDLQRRHVDVVHIGPLFAIDFDADEVVVHRLGNGLVHEDLPLHDVAPVATAVADGEED